jgi:hypothetical protein
LTGYFLPNKVTVARRPRPADAASYQNLTDRKNLFLPCRSMTRGDPPALIKDRISMLSFSPFPYVTSMR